MCDRRTTETKRYSNVTENAHLLFDAAAQNLIKKSSNELSPDFEAKHTNRYAYTDTHADSDEDKMRILKQTQT